jgi:hypothetical protein
MDDFLAGLGAIDAEAIGGAVGGQGPQGRTGGTSALRSPPTGTSAWRCSAAAHSARLATRAKKAALRLDHDAADFEENSEANTSSASTAATSRPT